MKHCKECGAQKAEADFYARRNSCKECVKASVRRNYAQNREHYREYERSRNSLPHRKEARDNYTKTEAGKERSNAAKRAYIQRNPEKRIAHNLTQSALKRNKIWRSPCCTAPGCFSTEDLHGHHCDYDRPLSVVWLCAKCHADLHRDFTAKSRAAA